MFVLEKVSKNDMELYKKLWTYNGLDHYRRWSEWFAKYAEENAKWCADRERGYYIICVGQHGPEGPYYFHMNYKDEIIEIDVYDLSDISWSDGSADIWVYIPGSLSNDKDDIARVVREAYSDNVFKNCSSLLFWQQAQIKEIKFRIKERTL